MGKRGSEDVGPRRETTDPHMIRFHRNSPKFGDAGDIDHRRRNPPLSQRWVEIRAPGQNLTAVGSEIVDRLVERPGPEIQASDPLGCRPNRRRMKGLPSIVIRSRLACTERGLVGLVTQDPVVGPWSLVVGKTKLFALAGGMANRGQVYPASIY